MDIQVRFNVTEWACPGYVAPPRFNDPGFLRERLAALPSEDFESLSSAYRYAVNGRLCVWDRELERHQEDDQAQDGHEPIQAGTAGRLSPGIAG